MSERNPAARLGPWLACGGLVILAAHQWLFAYQPQLSFDRLALLGGSLAGYLAMAIGLFMVFARKKEPAPLVVPANLRAEAEPIQAEGADGRTSGAFDGYAVLREMIQSFMRWGEEYSPDKPVWSAFDQLLREIFAERLGAARVRAFHVDSDEQQLCGLSQSAPAAEPRDARGGILGHVATTGREYFAADPSHGELVGQLAVDDAESWDWVIPIRRGPRTIGLVAIGKLTAELRLTNEFRRDVGRLLTLFWEQVGYRRQLGIAETTDKASGLLTRVDFFTLATAALTASYAENEPVVAVVLTLEGLRRLDDAGRWNDRDRLVENIGLLINRRIRTDDIIGRFSDDRFVLLLRRLDSGLGRLIVLKIQGAVRTEIAKLGELGAGLRIRIGLTGSGFAKEPLESLLARAFDAVEHARKQGLELYTDLAGGPADRAPDAAENPAVGAKTEHAPS